MKNKKFFSKTLLSWNLADNTRAMPWKGEKDPYKIWISEIILQQTRVSQGMSYYYKFIKSFPDVQTLAKAPEQLVFKHWEGLGYYSRCRNLISTAKFIHTNRADNFPNTYDGLFALKGVGAYTASAIASFAYNLPYAVVDGNVQRVLSRFFGVEVPVDTTEGKKFYSSLAAELLDIKIPGIYNQAIMDFGAVVCKPALPACAGCPLNKRCVAFKRNLVAALPKKEKNVTRRERFFSYLVVEYADKIYTRKRTQKDIWQGLYEFVLIETTSLREEEGLKKMTSFLSILGEKKYKVNRVSKTFTQKLTHQTITGNFLYISVQSALNLPAEYTLVSKGELEKLPFPKFITSYLED